MNLLIMADNGIGDCIMMLPTLRAFKHKIATELRVFSNPSYFDSVFYEFRDNSIIGSTDKNNKDYFPPKKNDFLNHIDWADIVIVLSTWDVTENNYLKTALSEKKTLGFFEGFCSNVIHFSKMNMIDQYFCFALFFDDGLDLKKYSYPIVFDDENIAQARKIKTLLPEGCKLVGIHSHTQSEKMVSPTIYHRLMNALLRHEENLMFVFMGPVISDVYEMTEHKNKIVLHSLPLATVLEFGKNCSLFIGIDSCILHAMDIHRVPCLALFPSTDPAMWGTKFSKSIYFTKENLSYDSIEQIFSNNIDFIRNSIIDKNTLALSVHNTHLSDEFCSSVACNSSI